MMSRPNHFYRLPRELRDHIYWSYFFFNDGYTLNPQTGKIQSLHGDTIDLSLRLVSRLIADETRGLALKFNAIHVSTWYSDTMRQRAGHFQTYLESVLDHITYSLQQYAAFSSCITTEVVAFLERNFPQFIPVIQHLQDSYNVSFTTGILWKEIPSLTRKFILSAATFIARCQERDQTTAADSHLDGMYAYVMEIAAFQNGPWIIPTEEDMVVMGEAIGGFHKNASQGEPYLYWDKEKYRFSAAATAIVFLNSCSPTTRLEIRKLVLHEDRVSVAWPECHAQGLIPFCCENPNVRIERVVSLWRTILPASSCPLFSAMTSEPAALHRMRCDAVRADFVSRGDAYQSGVAGWIMEAMALPSLGMPTNAFTLVIDGESISEQSAAVLDVVRRDAAWQMAFDTCTTPSAEPADLLRHRRSKVYIMHGFPAAIDAISQDSSFVRFNFEMGGAHSVDQLVKEGRRWTMAEWEEKWRQQHLTNFETEAPLLPWLDLRRENVLSE